MLFSFYHKKWNVNILFCNFHPSDTGTNHAAHKSNFCLDGALVFRPVKEEEGYQEIRSFIKYMGSALNSSRLYIDMMV